MALQRVGHKWSDLALSIVDLQYCVTLRCSAKWLVICIYMYLYSFLFFWFFSSVVLYDIEYSSLCYIAKLCCFLNCILKITTEAIRFSFLLAIYIYFVKCFFNIFCPFFSLGLFSYLTGRWPSYIMKNNFCACVCVLSCVWLFATPQSVV